MCWIEVGHATSKIIGYYCLSGGRILYFICETLSRNRLHTLSRVDIREDRSFWRRQGGFLFKNSEDITVRYLWINEGMWKTNHLQKWSENVRKLSSWVVINNHLQKWSMSIAGKNEEKYMIEKLNHFSKWCEKWNHFSKWHEKRIIFTLLLHL